MFAWKLTTRTRTFECQRYGIHGTQIGVRTTPLDSTPKCSITTVDLPCGFIENPYGIFGGGLIGGESLDFSVRYCQLENLQNNLSYIIIKKYPKTVIFRKKYKKFLSVVNGGFHPAMAFSIDLS